ncbi:hypothetical protein IFM89_016072 [Coptis chinensis]|uniref:RNase H type-1 domain-containing protein n=1 Tax=Coptis chinensis TaxID=261450 RepID=A0A835M2Q3_9MAGN|nr:hypothetical protein IFM89_016072 [Coptis chinensis]
MDLQSKRNHSTVVKAKSNEWLIVGIKLWQVDRARSSNRDWSSLLRLCKKGAQIGDIYVYAAFICASVDAIWRERNARMFKNNSKPAAVVLGRIIREMRVYLHIQISALQDTPESRSLCQSIGIQVHFKAKERKWCQWHLPIGPILKLNTDGALNDLGTGYGGVIRDGLMGVEQRLKHIQVLGGMQSVIFQELKAIEIGLIKCHELEVQDIEVESDSLWAIQTIKNVNIV